MRSLLILLAAASLLAGTRAGLEPEAHRLFVQQAVVSQHRCRGSGAVSTGRQAAPGHRKGFATSLPASLRPPQASPRESFDYWHKLYARAYAGVEVGRLHPRGWARSRSCRHPGCPRPPPPASPPQEYERRFLVWLDNLKFVLDYNARHTSHWVRRRRRGRAAGRLPRSHVPLPCAQPQCSTWEQRQLWLGGSTTAGRTPCLPITAAPAHRTAAPFLLPAPAAGHECVC